MNEFIYENNNSLNIELCNKIVDYFVNNIDLIKNDNYTNEEKKVCLLHNDICKNSKWYEIYNELFIEMIKNIDLYYKKIDPNNELYRLDILHKNKSFDGFRIKEQKILSEELNFNNDFDFFNNKYRILTFIWFLNNVEIGGDIVFFNNISLKVVPGKMIIFPSEWFFSYKEEIPISNNKYFIIGWIYNDL